MDTKNQKQKAEEFAKEWANRGSEKEDCHPFWWQLIHQVFGVDRPDKYLQFEKQVQLGHQSYIDVYIPETKVLIEQKSADKDLSKPEPQSSGPPLTPIEQAHRYVYMMPKSEQPRWIITCNFQEFWIYDEEHKTDPPYIIKLSDLPKEYHNLQFLINEKKETERLNHELEVSVKAGEIVGKLYDAFLQQYPEPVTDFDLHSLNVLCVRLVFCLYAENGGIFGKYAMFHDYLEKFDTQHMRKALQELFHVLAVPENQRDEFLKYDDPELAEFPYVNGGLFSDEGIKIPPFTDEIRTLLLDQASAGFDWSGISPTIFGAVFESTLNPETRRSGGMHYTSVENIHKVIDPLFLVDLKAEFSEIQKIDVERTRRKKLQDFQKKISALTFLDPACGSGNFLTETYLSLRRLENDVVTELTHGQITMGDIDFNPIMVSLDQFYGIEINDFAVTVAKTALWIAEAQMMQETEQIVHQDLNFLPLKSYTNIVEGNALRMDWNDVIPSFKINYIMGNPPFVGTKKMNANQKEDTKLVLSGWKNYGTLDYVSCWYKKASDYTKNTGIQCAFVSTNSICQGEQVANLWEPLISSGIHINFAYRTFRWDSEASLKAHVHCIIIGFSYKNITPKMLFDNGKKNIVNNINPYLVDADTVFIRNQKKPISNVPTMYIGCDMKDDGNYVMTATEKDLLIQQEPQAEQYIRPYMMGKDFIDRKPRYCLWLINANPSDLKNCPQVMERIKKVKEFRLNCPSPDTQKYASKPTYPVRLRYYSEGYDTRALALPMVSSENRKYVPMEIIEKDVIAGGKLFLIPEITLYHFGVLTSNVHMAWMRAVCGRLKSDYSYSSGMVYNTFSWPDLTPEQKAKIEQTAQAILDARALYPDSSLADLYDPTIMPFELQKAHHDNDMAVLQAYGWDKSISPDDDEAIVAELMRMYKEKTETPDT